MKRILLILLLLFVFLFSEFSQMMAQNPSIADLESQFGSLVLSSAFQTELEVAEMQKALQQGDSTGFSESFEEETRTLNGGGNRLLEQLTALVIRTLSKRKISPIDSLGMPGTFDFHIADIQLSEKNNKIDVTGNLEFTFVFSQTVIRGDTVQTSFARPFFASFRKNKNRWKIRNSQGIADFFLDAILSSEQKSAALNQKLARFESMRTGYPTPASIINGEKIENE